MAAIGQTWTLDTLTSSGLALGVAQDFDPSPGALGGLAFSAEVGINSAKWSDDSGYSANSNPGLALRGMASYIVPLGTTLGVTVDIAWQFCTYKFERFTVNESIESIGISMFLKF